MSAAGTPRPRGHLREVRLERYGAFTGSVVALPGPVTVVRGPNEAGKSTLLAAIADLLWGLEMQPAYAFDYARPMLRVGALWHGPDGAVELVRTSLGLGDGAGQAVEAPWSESHGRTGWLQGFGLSHEELRAGGRAVLGGGGDLAALVYTAHQGSGVDAVLAELDGEADRLWRKRTSRVLVKERAEAVRRAQQDLEGAETRAGGVEAAREELRAAEEEAAAADTAARSARKAADAAAGTARDLPRVRTLLRLRAAVAELLGAGAVLTGADLDRHAEASGRAGAARTRLDGLSAERAALLREREGRPVEAGLLAVGAEIDELRDAAQARAQDAERAGELTAAADGAAASAGALLRDLGAVAAPGTAPEELLEELRVPADRAADLTALAARCTALAEDARQAGEDLAERRTAERQAAGALAGPDEDAVTALRDLLAASPGEGSAAARWRAALTEADEHAATARRAASAAGALDPAAAAPVLDGALLRRELAALRQAREAAADREEMLHGLIATARAAAAELAEHEQRVRVRPEDLRSARAARDEAWAAVSAAGPLTPGAAVALDRALAHLDAVTDALLADAGAAARHDLLLGRLRSAELDASTMEEAHGEAASRRQDLEAAWRRRWADAGVSVPGDDALGDVLRSLGEAREATTAAAAARARAEALRGDVEVQLGALREALERAGAEGAAAPDLDVALAAARRIVAEADAAGGRRAVAEERTRDREHAEEDHRLAAAALAAAEEEWRAAAGAAGLPGGAGPAGWAQRQATLERAAEALQHKRNHEASVRVLTDRVADFLARVAGLAARLGEDPGAACDLAGARALLAGLGARLGGSRTNEEVVAGLDRRLSALADEQRLVEEELDAAGAELERLRSAAVRCSPEPPWPVVAAVALPDEEALADAAERGGRVRRLQEDEASAVALLAESHPDVEVLLAGLAERDDVDVQADADQLARARDEADRALTSAQQATGAARSALEKLERAADANVLAARCAEALAGLAEATERFVVVDLQRRLLREQLEEFAARHANPLLEEAGALLSALTGGRWSALRAADDGGRRTLWVRRADGREVLAGDGLSEGTADQVFLALRLAAIARQHRALVATTGRDLPVVLDDVLMTFDEERVAAALRVLARLGDDLQVIVLTHHAHVADAARELGVDVTALPSPGPLGAAPAPAAAPAGRGAATGGRTDPQVVRAWARREGIEVSAVGKLPEEVRRRYRQAHGLD
ncbi:hypothetical protein NUM3379_31020 [Kineococcus sp. NUM-3379]